MFEHLLLPDPTQLHIETWSLTAPILSLQVTSKQRQASCPDCHHASGRVHSRYQRTLADLACAGFALQLLWTVRRFFCDHPDCAKVTFTEQIQSVAQRYARKTARLIELQRQIAFELSGEAGKRVFGFFQLPGSGDRLLALIQDTPETVHPTPRVLGVDDWALRKGQHYGTLLIDLERHCPIELLPDREPQTLANWLKAHPGVEIITRDRGKFYVEGATQGAPNAVQVADRFHLLTNLQDVLKRMFEQATGEFRPVRKEFATLTTIPGQEKQSVSDVVADQKAVAQDPQAEISSYRMDRFRQVKDLHQQGVSQRAIARQVGIDRRTVKKYLVLDRPPEKVLRPQNQSSLLAFMPFLEKRWREGCRSRLQLLEELRQHGYSGSYASVYRATARFPAQGSTGPQQNQPPYRWSPRQAAWLLTADDAKLSQRQKTAKQALLAGSKRAAAALPLAVSFQNMVRERQAAQFDVWLEQAEEGELVEFRRFATSLRSDYQAVKQGLALEWSNGQTEGQVNRLKLIKRQMYGRAGFDLLRRRVLGL